MPDPNPTSFLEDPLSAIARTERRNLLIASVTGILVAKAGLLPTQISSLGIILSVPNQNAFSSMLAVTIIYFIGAFLIYGASDFFIWRKKYQEYLEHVERHMESWTEEDQNAYDMSNTPKIHWLYHGAPPLAFIRAFFEYVLPITVGFYATLSLSAAVLCP